MKKIILINMSKRWIIDSSEIDLQESSSFHIWVNGSFVGRVKFLIKNKTVTLSTSKKHVKINYNI